jgi:hypothetical protein
MATESTELVVTNDEHNALRDAFAKVTGFDPESPFKNGVNGQIVLVPEAVPPAAWVEVALAYCGKLAA